jgi:hypothetical protein
VPRPGRIRNRKDRYAAGRPERNQSERQTGVSEFFAPVSKLFVNESLKGKSFHSGEKFHYGAFDSVEKQAVDSQDHDRARTDWVKNGIQEKSRSAGN